MSDVTSLQTDLGTGPREGSEGELKAGAGAPPPPPPPLSQIEVGEQIKTLLIQRQLYRRQVQKTLSDSRSAIAALWPHADATKASSSVVLGDFAHIERVISSVQNAVSEIEKIDSETTHLKAALKEAEDGQRTLRFWIIAGCVIFILALFGINSR